ncbi:hypothetical protein EON79_15130 [bacterium]|nr:MAG: hypothetical protein EON79_15130 [bacterium]
MRRFRISSILLLASATLLPSLAPAQKVVAWGDNSYGQLNVPAGLVPKQVAAGGNYAMALRTDGTVAVWGSDTSGKQNIPADLVAADVSAGLFFCLARRANGTVVGWGSNNDGQTNIPAGLVATKIAAGSGNCLAIRPNGTVVGWDLDYYPYMRVPTGLVATQVAVGGNWFCLALRTNGTVVAWGRNSFGETDPPAGLVATEVSGGYYHALALRADGTVAAWGYNGYGACDVPTGLVANAITAGTFHSLAIRRDGTVAAWGDNASGECDVPPGLTGVLQASAGQGLSMALVAAAHCVVDQAQVYAGDSATGTVKLASPAPAGGAVVGLVSSDATVTVPATVTIPKGETERTFPITTSDPFGPVRQVTLRTSYNNTATVPFPLKVIGLAPKIEVAAASLVAGSTTKPALTLTLSYTIGEARVLSLTSSNPALAVPATVTIPAGQASLKIVLPSTTPVSNPTAATLSISQDGIPVVATGFTLNPLRTTVSFGDANVVSGSDTVGYLYLNAPVAQDLTVPLASSESAVTVPKSIVVKAGTRVAPFPISTSPSAANLYARITATISGNEFSGNLKVLATPGVKSLTLPALPAP